MKKFLLSIVAFSAFFANAQVIPFNAGNAREGESVEYCRQHTMQEHALANDAQYRAAFSAGQAQLERENGTSTAAKSGTVYFVPVVFHVLHTNGEENISDEQIRDAVDVLNRDFRKLNADANNVLPMFQGIVADAEIQFRLATKAPNGTCFNGITRTVSTQTNGSDGTQQMNAAFNGNNVYQGQWSHTNYLNIIVARNIGGAAGYTYLPSNGGVRYNSIFMLQEYVGRIGTGSEYRSRSLTHEVGHWLNLKHTWGDGNDPGSMSNCNMDDGVTDTPNTVGVQSCNLNEASCGPIANVENYMDYSYCSKMFTAGQVSRMRTAITSTVGGRNNLWSASNLANVGADGNLTLCKADFSADKKVVCVGSTVRFTDRSYNSVQSRTWSFPGGNASSTTGQVVDVTYNTPGVYNVSINAVNNGSTLSETKTAYIIVLEDAALPFFEGFENITNLEAQPDRWTVNNFGGTNKFEVTNLTAKTGTKSAQLRNFADRGSSVHIDELVSPSFDLSNESLGNVVLSFRYAYRRVNASSNDRLVIYMSSDCGESWDIRRTITAATLSGGVNVTNNWVAAQEDFVTFHLPFDASFYNRYFGPGYRFKFSFAGGGGNNFYLDDINLYSGEASDSPVLGLNQVNELGGMNIYPNPSQEELNVVYDLASSEKIEVIVMDITGKIISSRAVQGNAGTNVVVLDNSQLSAGSYLVNVVTATSKKVMQFVKM